MVRIRGTEENGDVVWVPYPLIAVGIEKIVCEIENLIWGIGAARSSRIHQRLHRKGGQSNGQLLIRRTNTSRLNSLKTSSAGGPASWGVVGSASGAPA